MRALPFIAAVVAWSALASADPPSTDPSSAPSTAPPPAPAPTFLRRMSAPRQFNPTLGGPLSPVASANALPLLRDNPRPVGARPAPPIPAVPPTPPATPPSPATPAPPATPIGTLIPIPPQRPRPKARPRKPEPPPLPAPDLALTLDAPSPEAPWTIRLANTGSIPLRIVADARLVALDVTPPNATRTTHPIKCELPSDMRPNEDEDRSLVLPPGRAFVEKIDPRLFCFGAHNVAALVAGASVVPRLVGSRDTAVVAPMEATPETLPVVATAHEWTGTATTIGPSLVVAAKDSAAVRTLALATPAFVDVGRAPEVAIPITATNESNASVVFLLRPETVALDIAGPSGIGVTDPSPTVHCAWSGPAPSPILELFSHLAPKRSDSLSVLPSVLCPEGTLNRPGLYVVRAKLDTRRASGTPIGLHTLDAQVAAETTTRLRVRATTGKSAPVTKPQLEALPSH